MERQVWREFDRQGRCWQVSLRLVLVVVVVVKEEEEEEGSFCLSTFLSIQGGNETLTERRWFS